MVERRRDPTFHFHNERPPDVRRSRTDLRARVNGDVQLEFTDVALTSHAGLELFGRYLRATGFNATVRHAVAGMPAWGDFGAVAMVRVLMGLLLVGGRRLRHLAFVQNDPLFQRFGEVQVVPTARTVSRWLQGFTMTTVARLQAINTAVVARVLATLGVRTWTIDVDGVVVSTGLQVERAFRGFNPHHRKVPSYYPIMAHLAETTHVLRVKNRSGHVHDGKAGLPFLRDLWAQLTTLLPHGGTVRFRMDGAFFRQDVLRWLGARHAGYAIKVPFYTLAGSTAVHPGTADLAAGGPGRHGLRRPAGGHAVGPSRVGGDLSQACPPSRDEELPIGPLRPERRALRVLGGHQQPGLDAGEPVAVCVRPRQSREDYRPAQERARLPHGTDHDVRGQQRMATPGGPHA